jgi:hypothetical protein
VNGASAFTSLVSYSLVLGRVCSAKSWWTDRGLAFGGLSENVEIL